MSPIKRTWPRSSLAAVLLLLIAAFWPAGSASWTGEDRSKITPALAKAFWQQPAETQKVWVYFTDKGIGSAGALTHALSEARQGLRGRSLSRRAKVRDEASLVDFADLPVNVVYADLVRSRVGRVRAVSRWLNALSVEATPAEALALSGLGFIERLDLVASFKRGDNKDLRSPEPALTQEFPPVLDRILAMFYGLSLAQLDQINVIPVHGLGYTGKGIILCMLDAGFRTSHEAFRNADLIAQWDFVNNDGDVAQDPSDPADYSDSHGTATWSLCGGFSPGNIIGPAFNASFILGKTETDRFERPIEEDWWVAGIEWAESLGADVVSSSLGYIDWYTFEDMDGKTAVTTRAANRAVGLGVVVVNAAGNERNDPWGHIIAPADGFGVIAVGAVNILGQIANFSSPGPTYDGRIKPEVCALGVNNVIAANSPGGEDIYELGSGTSFSTPLVAGVVAALLEAHPDWTPWQVRDALMSTASRAANPDNDYGWGIVNAFRALLK